MPRCTIFRVVNRWTLSLLFLPAFWATVASSTGCATVKTKDEMSAIRIAALEESQSRVEVHRQRIRSLQDDYDNNRIDAVQFNEARHALQMLVRKEIDVQGAIIRKDTKPAAKAQDVMDGVWRLAQYTPGVVLVVAAEYLKALCDSGKTVSVH